MGKKTHSSRYTREGIGPSSGFSCALLAVFLFTCLLVYLESGGWSPPSAPHYPLTDFSRSLSSSDGFWVNMRPGFRCPPSLLKRYGDSARLNNLWICDLSHLSTRKTCLVYSFGVKSGDASFEAEVLDTVPRCHVYLYDSSAHSLPEPLSVNDKRVHFQQRGLESLKTFIRDNGDHQWIDILKIDLEGQEYEVLERILEEWKEDLPFGRLNVAFHTGKWNPKVNRTYVIQFIQRLESRGLRLFHVEKRGVQGAIAQLAFVHVKQLDKVVDLTKEEWTPEETTLAPVKITAKKKKGQFKTEFDFKFNLSD